jgi:VWFA-related protein
MRPGKVAALALLVPALALAAEPALQESVGISLVQLEVTVWPKEVGSDACLGLGKDDFELEVAGKPQPIYSVDAVGAQDEVYTVPAWPEDAPSPGGMSVVLLFDLYHLDLFYRDYVACPRGLGLAFREARRYLEEEFRDGDRLLLVTFGAWPVVHEGWIRNRAEALRALGRLEKDRRVLADAGKGHQQHNGWIAGLESLFLAMGRYPGRKDVIWLGEDFTHDDVAMRMFEIAGRAQANGVVMSAVDLLDTCRSLPGPGNCHSMGGGLGCSPWRFPVALNPISRDTGGSLYRSESIARAVAALRAGRKCRYVVSFAATEPQRKRQQRIALRLRGDRRDVALAAPSAVEARGSAPTWAEREEALFLLPRFGRGLAAEAVIWPYRPAANPSRKERRPDKQRWDVFAIARLEHTADEAWPDELTEVTVRVLLHTGSKVHGSYKKTVVGEELAALRAPGGTRLLLFPVENVPPGETTLELTVTSNVPGIAANVRVEHATPPVPGTGEAGPWFLSDHLVRLGEHLVMAPSLDGTLARGEPAWMLGYGCPPKTPTGPAYQAALLASSGGAAVPVTLTWLPDLRPDERACGWLFGKVASDLAPDLWQFDPPSALTLPGTGGRVEFTVEGAGSTETKPH